MGVWINTEIVMEHVKQKKLLCSTLQIEPYNRIESPQFYL